MSQSRKMNLMCKRKFNLKIGTLTSASIFQLTSHFFDSLITIVSWLALDDVLQIILIW